MEDSEPSLSRNLVQAVNSIPLDLTFEILSKLPAKPLIRFQTVSKLWFSIIHSKNFTDSFLTRSKTQPRLLLTFKHFDSRKRFIFSAPEHDQNNENTVVARHDMTISDLLCYIRSRPVNGLICCIRGSSIAVCNPTTRQIVKLPDVERNGRDVYARLGYDPVQDQYKVLCVMMFDGHCSSQPNIPQEHFVCTVRSGQEEEWRKIENIGDPYTYFEDGVCIDGAIYYGVLHQKIARFDVRSEKIEFIQGPKPFNVLAYGGYSTLTNYQGKLAGVSYDFACDPEMSMWILQDVEKQEWSSVMTCDVPCHWREFFIENKYFSSGEIHTNEVMMVSRSLELSKLFCVYYCDLIKESIRKVEVDGIADCEFRRVHGIGKHGREMLCFPGHIENIMFF